MKLVQMQLSPVANFSCNAASLQLLTQALHVEGLGILFGAKEIGVMDV